MSTTVDDAAGNSNGRLDPGETANLLATIKNVGGTNFTNITSVLSSSDPNITINDNSAVFGPLSIDSTKTNVSDPFNLSVDVSTPEGYEAAFNLVVTDAGFCDTFSFDLTVGKYSYLVLNLDPSAGSGIKIDSILSAIGYSGIHSIQLPSDLSFFKSIFVCLGVYPNNTVISSGGAIATSIIDFINNGGCAYMEGGDMWFYDPSYGGGHNFGPVFGIQAVADGSGNLGPVVGASGTFTNSMNFAYAGENSYIDQINATGTGFVIFSDGNDNYNCGVANQTATYRTVGTSFELGMLTDAADASTRADILDSIMVFFLDGLNAVAEQPPVNSSWVALTASPNPFVKNVLISFTSPAGILSEVEIFDVSGRTVREFNFGLNDADRLMTVHWNGNDNQGQELTRGVYFVKVTAGENSGQVKLIFVE
ncbi:T9SS type A sorting domain-containing protein [candidate division WOR-3 bacterium]|nr:T9SS type A sorting domain-containing protein [candidate division WOR-3 bacterium]